MMTLPDFLRARIADDEQRFHSAAEAHAAECRHDGMPDTTREDIEAYWLREGEWSRYVAEYEAKARIVYISAKAAERPPKGDGFEEARARQTLRHLASIYADHPDYRDEWRADV